MGNRIAVQYKAHSSDTEAAEPREDGAVVSRDEGSKIVATPPRHTHLADDAYYSAFHTVVGQVS